MLPPSVEGREPGVYLRSNRPENDLDFLWDKERRKHIEHDRFNIGYFLAGMACGAILTLVATFIFFSGGKLFQPADHAKPLIEEQMLLPDAATPKNAEPEKPKAKEEPKKDNGFFGFNFKPQEPKVETKPAKTTTTDLSGQTYEVAPGDTLGGIAYKAYHSADPTYVERIQKANNLESADSLKIGQKITIPPKSY